MAAAQADPSSVGAERRSGAPTGIGHSAAVSPYGEVLAELGPSPGLLFVYFEIEVIGQARATIPVIANRRL